MDRRNFLFNSASALGLFAAGDLATLVNNHRSRSTQLAKVALQLYTVRDQVSKDARGTLAKIAGMGIDTVETAFWPENISVKQAAALLKNAGLKVCSAHVELPIGNQKDRM